MTHSIARNHRVPCRRKLAALSLVLALASLPALADDAQIVSLQGDGEAKESPQRDWRRAVIRERLRAGAFVRTGDASRMALLLEDRTQLHLNQNSLLQIKEVAAANVPTRLELPVGRVWMQAKGQPAGAPGTAPRVIIETPNATAAIRGTDWELAVDERGAALLTVLSGEVELYNELGRVFVARSEQARVEPGRAPVKTLLTQPRQRVQWVTAYRPDPGRWARRRQPELAGAIAAIEAGRHAEAMRALQQEAPVSMDHALLLADLLLAQGRIDEAIAGLDAARQSFAPDGRVAALLARAYVLADRGRDAEALLKEALVAHRDEVEVWLARGDLARFGGDARAADAAFRQALALQPDSAAAWLGIGVVAGEREDVRPAQRALAEALRIDPRGPGYLGEWGTLHTFADDFEVARSAFASALADRPDDFVALTGLGVLQLKRGEPEAALRSFLEAGVIEPRYARSALYTGVAYYQLGQRERAVEVLRRAAELDPRDPMPWLMLAVVASDRLDWGEALVASREALQRMPNLRSLNQLLDNQKGYAGVGSAIASFGLEEWAQAYAYEAYNPFWAGSHLFLADRMSGLFNKNSELFQGFLTDPTVFGASNRFSTLVPRPGDYTSLAAVLGRQDQKAGQLQAIFNGYHNESRPIAYHLSLDGLSMRPIGDGVDGRQGVATVGLGMRPRHDVGLFLFGTRTRVDVDYAEPALGFPGNPVTLDTGRADAGINVKFAPDSQAWLKVGSGREKSRMGGDFSTVSDGIRLDFHIDSMSSRNDTRDWQWRHTVDLKETWQLSWGAEYGRQEAPFSIDVTTLESIAIAERERTERRSRDLYASNRLRLGADLLLQADLAWQRLDKRYSREDFLTLPGMPPQLYDSVSDDRAVDEVNGRLGAAWRAGPGQTLRVAWQRWRRPAAVSTLGPVDTAGIPVDDRLVTAGGRLQRARAQLDWEVDPRTFANAFVDRRTIDNVPNPEGALAADFVLTDLERLHDFIDIDGGAIDFYEGDPEFGAGRVKAAGVALNRVVASNLTAAFRYYFHDGENTTAAYAGNAVPYLPRHAVQVGATWVAMPRLQLSGLVTFRNTRYADEANTERLESGWNLGLSAYWETWDKRWLIGAIAENLLSDKDAGVSRRPLLAVGVMWRQ